ncbi:MAG: bifunctional glutamate N-acetyltransferase/amino-acid acetyltransferase ArgJ [Armatimonadetes bacterium]|nr:bifunctional glutamate N-acetyltransferase/amino-acid acetyltransferase ArgJ [Armatimonadota bacterium]
MRPAVTAGSVTTPGGVRAAGGHCGIKAARPDLALVVTEAPAPAAACFTTNRVQAAPVQVSRGQIRSGRAQAVVINSGNANACTGEAGLRDAWEMVDLTARAVGVSRDLVLVASTGVIGVPLPMEALRRGIPAVATSLGPYGEAAAEAILTTDAFPKTGAVEVEVGGRPVRLGGMAKGAGMIHPRMATTLSMVTTDAALEPALAQRALSQSVARSFNRVSVDGDTSTNDTIVLLATGAAGHPPLRGAADPGFDLFQEALTALTEHLARLLVRDGEGATKLIEIAVTGAATEEDAARAGEAILTSPLVKTACYGMEPNWGRILAAVGRSGAEVDPARVAVAIGGVQVVAAGVGRRERLAAASAAMRAAEFIIAVDLGLGSGAWTGWTCDLTEAYVRLNSGSLT